MSQSKIRWPEMAAIHSLLLGEQLLGSRVFSFLLGGLKSRVLSFVARRHRFDQMAPPIPVDRIENLSPEEFRRQYFNRSKPVVISGAAKNWPCCRKWSLDFFSLAHGGKDTLIVEAEGLTTREQRSDHHFQTVRELIAHIKEGGDRYLRFSPLLHDQPELAGDLDLDWLARLRGGRTFGNTYYMFMGGKGQTTYLHNDQPCNLYVQVCGEKKWTLYYPKDSACLYPQVTNAAYVKSPVNIDSPDYERYPLFKSAQAYTVHLKAGDVLYVPPHVWHQVENLTDSIAVGYRFSSLKAALKSSTVFSLIRILSTNPPVWKTRQYGKIDTNLIWAHSAGKIEQVLEERDRRQAPDELVL